MDSTTLIFLHSTNMICSEDVLLEDLILSSLTSPLEGENKLIVSQIIFVWKIFVIGNCAKSYSPNALGHNMYLLSSFFCERGISVTTSYP
jgi:hypothetical protein